MVAALFPRPHRHFLNALGMFCAGDTSLGMPAGCVADEVGAGMEGCRLEWPTGLELLVDIDWAYIKQSIVVV